MAKKQIMFIILILLAIVSCGKKEQEVVIPPPKIEVFFSARDVTNVTRRIESNVTVIRVDYNRENITTTEQSHWYTRTKLITKELTTNRSTAIRSLDITNTSETSVKLDANAQYVFYFEPDNYYTLKTVFDLGNLSPTYNFT